MKTPGRKLVLVWIIGLFTSKVIIWAQLEARRKTRKALFHTGVTQAKTKAARRGRARRSEENLLGAATASARVRSEENLRCDREKRVRNKEDPYHAEHRSWT